MSVEYEVVKLIINDPDCGALLGAGADARVYYADFPQAPIYPAVNVSKVLGPRTHHLKGPDGYEHARLQIDIYAKTWAEIKQPAGVRDCIRRLLNGYKGGGIRSVIMINDRDWVVPDALAKRVMLEFNIWYKET